VQQADLERQTLNYERTCYGKMQQTETAIHLDKLYVIESEGRVVNNRTYRAADMFESTSRRVAAVDIYTV
jgi:hypothetical protein